MLSILHLRRELREPPVVLQLPGTSVRNMLVPDDIASWLELRDRAMADETPRARSWNEYDFHAEMLDKPWWRADRSWLAFVDERQLVGAVTLALREGNATRIPVVHWLVVDPVYRRRGIARVLMAHLERAAWESGWRAIGIETHAKWTGAIAFYHSIGYTDERERSPR
ncbi:MAG TPA: GNAT family N-acetyltransferase [Lacipirellulaceae bacterium]|nr:GNAT family N-acetyltransferase [Lacipirellulaceae bacterium]